jgi:hypothetical protein
MDSSIEVPHQETLNTPAARLLYRVMTGISEDCWCAGWLVDCEYALWANLTGKDVVGVKAWRISVHEVEELRLAHEVAGGWIVWSDERRGLIFLTTEKWLEHLAVCCERPK